MQTLRTPVRSPRALGDHLARLRFERGLTQAELAEKLGFDRRYIHELESGKQTRYATRLFEILRELDVRIELVTETQRDVTDLRGNGELST